MCAGFITLNRKLLEWEWSDDPEMGWLWVQLLLRANHEDNKWHGMIIQRGQLVTSIAQLASFTGVSVRGIRTRLVRLSDGGCINIKTTNKYTIITICKYDSYQRIQGYPDKQTTNKRQTNDKQTTTNNNENNDNNISLTYTREEKSGEDSFFQDLTQGEGYQSWRERICMNRHFTIQILIQKLTEFHQLMQERMETHADIRDYASHFINMIENRQYEKTTTRSHGNSGSSSPSFEIGQNYKPSFDD